MQQKVIMATMAVAIGCLCGALHSESTQKADPWYVQYKEVQMKEVTMQQVQKTVQEVQLVKEYDPDIPKEVQEAAEYYGKKYSISPEFLEAVAWKESKYNPDAVNASGTCIGLMQVNPKWHKARMEKLNVEDLTDLDGCMEVAADYLYELFEKYEDPATVLMVYNGDSSWKQGNVSKYAKGILKMARELEEKHKKMS